MNEDETQGVDADAPEVQGENTQNTPAKKGFWASVNERINLLIVGVLKIRKGYEKEPVGDSEDSRPTYQYTYSHHGGKFAGCEGALSWTELWNGETTPGKWVKSAFVSFLKLLFGLVCGAFLLFLVLEIVLFLVTGSFEGDYYDYRLFHNIFACIITLLDIPCQLVLWSPVILWLYRRKVWKGMSVCARRAHAYGDSFLWGVCLTPLKMLLIPVLVGLLCMWCGDEACVVLRLALLLGGIYGIIYALRNVYRWMFVDETQSVCKFGSSMVQCESAGQNSRTAPANCPYKYTFSHSGGIFSSFEGVATRDEFWHGNRKRMKSMGVLFAIAIALGAGAGALDVDDWVIYTMYAVAGVFLAYAFYKDPGALWNGLALAVRRTHAFGKSYLWTFFLTPLKITLVPTAVFALIGMVFGAGAGAGMGALAGLVVGGFIGVIYSNVYLFKIMFGKAPIDLQPAAEMSGQPDSETPAEEAPALPENNEQEEA
ncbi:MAG: hypothetical protein J6R92_03025 [Akkermansia sp.]|nr:hypothetical protein [Akkermansia sp.]